MQGIPLFLQRITKQAFKCLFLVQMRLINNRILRSVGLTQPWNFQRCYTTLRNV
jgi:hypothetical protein